MPIGVKLRWDEWINGNGKRRRDRSRERKLATDFHRFPLIRKNERRGRLAADLRRPSLTRLGIRSVRISENQWLRIPASSPSESAPIRAYPRLTIPVFPFPCLKYETKPTSPFDEAQGLRETRRTRRRSKRRRKEKGSDERKRRILAADLR